MTKLQMPVNISDKLTILVVTFNRTALLQKSLKYKIHFGLACRLIVLDGSSKENAEINRTNIQGLNCPWIEHRSFPSSMHLGLRIKEGIDAVTTPYVLIWPDDDLLNASCLPACVDFLEHNSDFSASLGRMLCLRKMRLFSKICPWLSYTVIDHLKHVLTITDNSGLTRNLIYQTLTCLGAGPLYYSVRRTTQQKRIYHLVKPELKYTSLEQLIVSQTMLEGKLKQLDVFYGLRNYSSEATSDATREASHGKIMEDNDVLYIKKVFSEFLSKKEGISLPMAEFACDQLIQVPYHPSQRSFGYGTSVEEGVPFYKLKVKLQFFAQFIPPLIGYFYRFESSFFWYAVYLRV